MQRLDFPKDFIWGTATASYQIEGGSHEGGREECIWDTFARKPGAVYAGENGNVACDHYHRYEEDVALMAELGFKYYRFSIAWPRIIPAGTGKVNPEGIKFYRKLCEELHKHGIKACATLYHWDLPQPLEDAGGWPNRSIVSAFEEYAKVCFKELGDVVDMWFTINEPLCAAYLGYLYGTHAPGYCDIQKGMSAAHHLNMAHGVAVREYRKMGLTAPIGTAWNPSTPRPATQDKEDIEASKKVLAENAEIFILPCLGKGYPEIILNNKEYKLPIQDGDMELIAQPIDFMGINYYFEHPAGKSKNPSWQETTYMSWPIVPGGLKRLLEWMTEISDGKIPIYITENGCAYDDMVTPEGRVHDAKRIEYFQKHLTVCADAIKQGIPLKGYFAWSLLDNFEWSYGYTRRFGIIHVDFKTMKRTIKDSGYFFRDTIAGYGEW
jgi:beta-glucosidase